MHTGKSVVPIVNDCNLKERHEIQLYQSINKTVNPKGVLHPVSSFSFGHGSLQTELTQKFNMLNKSKRPLLIMGVVQNSPLVPHNHCSDHCDILKRFQDSSPYPWIMTSPSPKLYCLRSPIELALIQIFPKYPDFQAYAKFPAIHHLPRVGLSVSLNEHLALLFLFTEELQQIRNVLL